MPPSRPMKTLGKWLLRAFYVLLIVHVIVITSVYAIRTWLLPDLTVLQPRIEAKLTQVLQQPVRLQGLSAAWNWASVDLKLSQLAIGPLDAPLVQAQSIETTVSAYPLLWGSVNTQTLSAAQVTLSAQQTGSKTQPKWFIAGVDIAAPSDGSALRWALNQPSISVAALNINVQDAAAHWIPETKTTVKLGQVAFTNSGRDHHIAGQFAANYSDARLGSGVSLDAAFTHALTGDMTAPRNWTGSASLKVPQAHIASISAWLLGLTHDATASSAQSNAWLRWAKQSIEQATLGTDTVLTFKQGALAASGQTTVHGLSKPVEATFAPFDWSWAPQQEAHAIQVKSAKLSLAPLAALVETMPLPAELNHALSQAKARGSLSDLNASAVLSAAGVQSATFSAQAAQLGMQSIEWHGGKGDIHLPTLNGISGTLKVTHTPAQTDTHIALNTAKGFADLPRLFENPRVDFDSLTGDIDLKLTAQQIALSLSKVRFKNTDLDGEIKGQYTVSAQRSSADKTLGLAQLSGEFARADLAQLHRYMPLSLSADARDWLRHTISQGQANRLQFNLNGELSRFPFLPDIAQAGERFDLQASINHATLNFNPLLKTPTAATPVVSTLVPSVATKSWPLINDVSGELQLHGLSLTLQNMEGLIQAMGTDTLPLPLRMPKLSIASLTAPVVVFQARVEAPAANMLSLVRNTPLSQSYGDQLAVLKATGTVNVDANLSLDIAQPTKNLTQGTFKLANASLQINKDLPPLEQINTTLAFNQHSIKAEQANALWLGGSVQVSGGIDTQDASQILKVQGTAQLAAIKQYSPNAMAQALLSHAEGAVDYSLNVSAKPEGLNWQVLADLKEAALNWPGLLDKPAGVPLPFSLTRTPTQRTLDTNTAQESIITQDTLEASLGATVLGPFKGIIERRLEGTEWRMIRGAVALGEQAALNPPDQGLGIHIAAGKVNLDQLRKEIESLPWAALPTIASDDATKVSTQAALPPPWMPSVMALQVEDLTLANRRFYNIVGVASRSGSRGQTWNANLIAKGINGYVTWTDNSSSDGVGGGQLLAKLTELTIPASDVQSTTQELLSITPKQVPSVDLSIDQLTVGDKSLGAVTLKANNLAQLNARLGWDIEQFSVTLPHTTLSGKGAWTHAVGELLGEVKLNLDLNTDSLGDTLDGLGLGKIVAGAAGTIKGDVAWRGTPFSLDLATLSGALNADFSKGQFLKVDPGAGRLVGLFSLQNLPRRLTLDFKDMFGTGFAFDQVTATATIEKGLLTTDDFVMGSSAAQVTAKGEVALADETQSLIFTVKPNFDAGSVSLLYMIINPPVGLATLAAQFLFREPLRKSLTVEYSITGPWAKPDVQQLKREIK
jgi:uncharacterized protein (TIGR02099 family)